TALDVLALSAGYNPSQAGVFRLDYSDNSSDQYTQGVSEWTTGYTGVGGTTAPGESIAATMSYYNNTVYGPQQGTHAYLYGYNFAINPNKTLSYIQLNNNPNMAIFAIDLVNTQAKQQIAMAPASGSSALGSANSSSVQGDKTSSTIAVDAGTPTFSGPADPADPCFAWAPASPAGEAWAPHA
ncbi:MAG: hypothetical protein ACP5XB_13785, partial [Isosphaeraceae bacterium]